MAFWDKNTGGSKGGHVDKIRSKFPKYFPFTPGEEELPIQLFLKVEKVRFRFTTKIGAKTAGLHCPRCDYLFPIPFPLKDERVCPECGLSVILLDPAKMLVRESIDRYEEFEDEQDEQIEGEVAAEECREEITAGATHQTAN